MTMSRVENRLISGIAGTGKTIFTKKELLSLLEQDFHLLVFDPTREYKALFEQTYPSDLYQVPVSHVINPFYFLEGFHEPNIDGILSYFFCYVLDRELEQVEIKVISECIYDIRRKSENEFSLEYFLTMLRKENTGKSLSFEFLMKNKEHFHKSNKLELPDKKIIFVPLGQHLYFKNVAFPFQNEQFGKISQKIITNWNSKKYEKKLSVFEEHQMFHDKSLVSFLHTSRIPTWFIGLPNMRYETKWMFDFFEEFIIFRLHPPMLSYYEKMFDSIKPEVWTQAKQLDKGEYLFFTKKR